MIASAKFLESVDASTDLSANLSETHEEILVGIGEAARIVGVASHTVRYWEKEFGFYLKPPRTHGRQRRYDEDTLNRLRLIHRMLKEEGYSIAGAKRILSKQEVVPPQPFAEEELREKDMASRIIRLIREELLEQQTAIR